MSITVQNIYKRVRWCFDEEAVNAANLADASVLGGSATGDTALMNNIIKDKIADALRWICLYAPAEQLSGGGSSQAEGINIVTDATDNVPADGRITLGTNFIRLIRVRCSGWHRAVMGASLLKEDSDDYLQLMDENGATATNDRPQAALIESAEKKVEVWPHTGGTYELTKLVMPSISDLSNITPTTPINIPPLLEAAFIFYLAFLTLSAYGDVRAARMLEIARMNLGITEDKQRQ
jgi:hypothetical protein